jgi:hypothetical protein
MKLTKKQQEVYNRLSYEWRPYSILRKAKGSILLDLIRLGFVECRLGDDTSFRGIYYRKANKRIMVG